MANTRSIRILLNDEDLGAAQEVARTTGIDLQILPKPQVVEPFTAILVAGGVVLTVKFVADLIDRFRGGVVVDMRPDAEYFARRDRSLPYGWAVIIAADGKTVKIETRDAPVDAAERLLKAIVDGTLKTSQEIAKAAKDALGAGKVQESPAASYEPGGSARRRPLSTGMAEARGAGAGDRRTVPRPGPSRAPRMVANPRTWCHVRPPRHGTGVRAARP